MFLIPNGMFPKACEWKFGSLPQSILEKQKMGGGKEERRLAEWHGNPRVDSEKGNWGQEHPSWNHGCCCPWSWTWKHVWTWKLFLWGKRSLWELISYMPEVIRTDGTCACQGPIYRKPDWMLKRCHLCLLWCRDNGFQVSPWGGEALITLSPFGISREILTHGKSSGTLENTWA